MNHKQMFTVGSVLMLVILLTTACDSLSSPRITITFSADEKCTMEGATTIPAGKNIPMEVIGNIKGGGNVGVAILSLDPDKTIKDLQEWFKVSGDQPSWTLRNYFSEFPSDGSSSVDLNFVNGPIYFLCLYELAETPSGIIGVLGPVEVK